MGFTRKRTKIESKKPAPQQAPGPDAANAAAGAAPAEEAGSETPMLDAVADQSGGDAPREGSSVVVNAATENQYADDRNSYTESLIERQKQDPDADIDDVAKGISDDDDHLYSDADHAETGRKDVADDGKKQAVYVGNEDYTRVSKLPGAARDASAMRSTYSARGFTGELQADQKGVGISRAFQGALQGLGPGDRALVYFAGHGLPKGLVGVDHDPFGNPYDIAPHVLVTGLVSQAEARGFHLTAILDACHSGAATDKVSEERYGDLDKEGEPEIVRNLAKVGKLIVRGRRRVMEVGESGEGEGEGEDGRGFKRRDEEDRGFEQGDGAPSLGDAWEILAKASDHYASFTDGDTAVGEALPARGAFVEGGINPALDVISSMNRALIARIEAHRSDP